MTETVISHIHHFIKTELQYVCDLCGEVSPEPVFDLMGSYCDKIKNGNEFIGGSKAESRLHVRDQYSPALPKMMQVNGLDTCFWNKKEMYQNKPTHDPHFYQRIWHYYTAYAGNSRAYIRIRDQLYAVMNDLQITLPYDQFVYIISIIFEYGKKFKIKDFAQTALIALYIVKAEYKQGFSLAQIYNSHFMRTKNGCFRILQNFISLGFHVDKIDITLSQLNDWLCRLKLPSQWIYPISQHFRRIVKDPSSYGKNYAGIVAAILYLYARSQQMKLPQDRIASTVNVTEVTLRNNVKRFQSLLSFKPRKVSVEVN